MKLNLGSGIELCPTGNFDFPLFGRASTNWFHLIKVRSLTHSSHSVVSNHNCWIRVLAWRIIGEAVSKSFATTDKICRFVADLARGMGSTVNENSSSIAFHWIQMNLSLEILGNLSLISLLEGLYFKTIDGLQWAFFNANLAILNVLRNWVCGSIASRKSWPPDRTSSTYVS